MLTVKGDQFIAKHGQKCQICREQLADTLTVCTVEVGYVHAQCQLIYDRVHEMIWATLPTSSTPLPSFHPIGTQSQMEAFIVAHPDQDVVVRNEPRRSGRYHYLWRLM